MSKTTSTFHIGDPGPEELYQYLDTIEAHSPSTNEEFRSAAESLGHRIAELEKAPSFGGGLVRLGVLDGDNRFNYTSLGDQLVGIMYRDRNLFNNLLHYLYFTAYERYPTQHIYSSYTYRELTKYLYDNAPYDSLYGEKGSIIGEIEQQASNDDLDLTHTQRGISVSTKTVNNYLQYITNLQPSVNPNEPDETPGFVRRGFCPPELFIMAVKQAYTRNNTEYNTLLRATDEIKRYIKQLCLLSEDGFTEVMDYADQAYPYFRSEQDFGLNFRLEVDVTFDDLE